MKVVKRDGTIVDYDRSKIITAIEKANAEVSPEEQLSRDRIDQWFRKKGIRPNVYAEVAGNEALLAMVSLGCGVGVVPELVLEKSPLREQVRICQVEPGLAPFIIGACTLEKNLRNPVIQAFWTTVLPVEGTST